MTDLELLKLSNEARKKAYAPYSKYKVGAALLCKNGKVYLGANIENASFGATNCAERTAFFNAINDGERDFEKIAVVGSNADEISDFFQPCGICRQVMREFCNDDFVVLMGGKNGEFTKKTLAEILPFSFGPNNMKG